ncbi:DEAD/DEAH box helicase [Helcobacillus massiliensis]|uniref:Superfamily II DNA or RNA helicase n=1 Tax=Helcobacillus massiliensis TaxID=521392 RepID=A0A839QTR9_9MICO|nr:DEAD/DEAH box helicase [Helcobacillus massiliensis]MBB3023704.1 superfamily II DNA or RNA helicase [Helcobacillus massiliensis]
MAENPALPVIDHTHLQRRFGDTVLERAEGLIRRGQVLHADWSPENGSIDAMVQGTDPQPYSQTIKLRRAAGDPSRWSVTLAHCSCPVRLDCKHSAAVLLDIARDAAALAAADRLRGGSADTTTGTRPAGTTRHAGRTEHAGHLDHPEHAERPATPEWRTALSSLLRDEPREQEQPTPLAIGFELDAEKIDKRPFEWGQEPAAAEHIAAGKPLFVKIRPLKAGKRNNWVRSGLSWRTFEFRMRSLGYVPEQADALHRIFAAAESERSHVSGTVEHLWLNSINTDMLWEALHRAREAGVAFVGLGSVKDVELADRAAVDLRLSRPGEEQADGSAAPDEPGDLALRPVLTMDGEEMEIGRALGAHGALAVTHMTRAKQPKFSIRIGGMNEPMPTQLQSLLARPEPLVIPAEDRDMFLLEAYPRLQRTVPVTTRDDSIDLPQIRPATLELTASYGKEDSLNLDWAWRYHDPERTLPMNQQVGARRTIEHEDAVLAQVRMLWPTAGGTATERLHGVDTAEFTTTVLDQLMEMDFVEVRITGTRHAYRELDDAPHVRVTQTESPGKNDWFDLGFHITIDGREIPFPTLFVALAKGQSKVLMPDKTFFSLERPEFDALRELIQSGEQMQEWEPDVQRISRYQMDLWDDIEAVAQEAETAATWDAAVGRLRTLTDLEDVPAPDGLNAQLRPYQRDGLTWLGFLWRHGLGGILADDMGLGKTLQALALIAHARERQAAGDEPVGGEGPVGAPSGGGGDGSAHSPGAASRPFLVVAPSSVLGVWQEEAARFTPGLRVGVIDQTRRARGTWVEDEADGFDILITSYTILRIDADDFARLDYDGVILDEAQFVKNRASRVHQAAARLQAPFRLAITGTPMENSLADLWSLLSLTATGLFPSPITFREQFTKPIESGEHPERVDVLRRRIRPFMLRRTKELVAKDLPAKQEQVLSVELEKQHRKLYDSVLQRERKKVLGLLDDIDKNRFIVFRSLTLLRMLALDPGIVDETEHEGVESSKLNSLFEHLEEVLSEGHRVLVFSQFTSFLRRVAGQLEQRGVAFSYLDGSTRNRGGVIEEFREGANPVFLISLKAGGFGLTLTEADYVFLLDPWWNPAAEAQAVDRAHRIGQQRNVMVYRMVAQDTIEEKVLQLQQKKAALFSSLTDGGDAFAETLSADDIRGLLEG